MHLHHTHCFPWGSILPSRTIRTRQALQAKTFFLSFSPISNSFYNWIFPGRLRPLPEVRAGLVFRLILVFHLSLWDPVR